MQITPQINAFKIVQFFQTYMLIKLPMHAFWFAHQTIGQVMQLKDNAFPNVQVAHHIMLIIIHVNASQLAQ
jgi:hypothetical protein